MPTYSISSALASFAGQYRVIADNGAGQTISRVFTLSFDSGSGSPDVAIQSPSAGAIVSGTVTVSITNSAIVGKVAFCLDGVPQVTNSTAPFTWSWNRP